jgi:hypothetical protein
MSGMLLSQNRCFARALWNKIRACHLLKAFDIVVRQRRVFHGCNDFSISTVMHHVAVTPTANLPQQLINDLFGTHCTI